jgi:hypothetical protein
LCQRLRIEDQPEPKEVTNTSDDLEYNKNWNHEFQALLDQSDSKEKFEKIRDLASDFVYCAKTYGIIIISELSLPYEEKTVKPGRYHTILETYS